MDNTFYNVSKVERVEKERSLGEESSFKDLAIIVTPKQLRCSMRRKKCIGIWTFIFIALSSALILGLYFGLKKGESRYKPPQIGTIFYANYTSTTTRPRANETGRFLEETVPEEVSTSMTYIVVNSSAGSVDMLVIPGTVTEKQLRNLRGLDDSNNENEDLNKIPMYLVSANTDEGKVVSMQASKAASSENSENVVSGVQMALVSTNGDDQARNMASKETCEDHFTVLYCPTYKRHAEGKYYVLTAIYGKDSLNKHRSLQESDDLSTKTDINITKQSYIDNESGALVKSQASGTVNLPMVNGNNSTNQSETSQNLTLSQNVSANFDYDSQSLTAKESTELNQYITTNVEFVNIELKPNPKNNIEDNSDLSDNTRRNLGIYVEKKSKLVDILGLPIYFKSVLEETPEANLKAKSSINFSGLMSLDFGSQEFGNGFLKKLKKIFTLKNSFEKLISEVQEVITSYENNELKNFNKMVLIKLAELQSLLIDSSEKLTNLVDGVVNKGKIYSDNVLSITIQHQEMLENQNLELQKLIQNLTETTLDPLNQKIISVNELKKECETQLEENLKLLDELKDKTLKNLNNQKDQLSTQIDAEIKKYYAYVSVEKAFKKINEDMIKYSKKQVMDLDLIKNATQSFEFLSSTVKEELKTLNSYVQSELIEYKSQIDSKITELTKNVEDIKNQIYNQVTLATNQIVQEIEDLSAKVSELEQQIESSSESEKQNLITQKDVLVAQINEKRNKIENEIYKKKEVLENQKKDLEQTLDFKIEEAKTELNSQINKWKDSSQNIQDTLSKQLSDSILFAENAIGQAKLALKSEVENLKNIISNEVSEKRDTLEQTISRIEEQIELEVLNLESLNQLKSEINSALAYGKAEIQSLNMELAKTKEEIIEEIISIKIGLKNQITYLESELKSKVYDIKSDIESDIVFKQQHINELRNQIENANEDSINDLNNQINFLETDVSELQLRLSNLNTIELELLDQKENFENKLKDIINDYTYQLYLKANSFKDFYTNQENRVSQISIKTINLEETIEFYANSLKSESEKVTKEYNQEIEPYLNYLESNLKKLNLTEQDLNTSIQINEIKIKGLTSENENLNLIIIEAAFNMTKIQAELNKALIYYETLEKNFTDTRSIIDSILNKTFEWTQFFNEKTLFSIKDELEIEINSVFDNLNFTASKLESSINTVVKAFDLASSQFTLLSKEKSSQLLSSGTNINNLPLSSSLNTKTELFDFNDFNQKANQVNSTFSRVRSTIDTLVDLSTKNIEDDLIKLGKIGNPLDWDEKLNVFTSNIAEIENKFKIKLNVNNLKELIYEKLESSFKVKITKAVKLLSFKDKLKSTVNDFTVNSLQSIASSQTLTSTFINYLGDLASTRKNLKSKSLSFTLIIGVIPTPIGPIVASLKVKAGISLDLVSILSTSKLSTSLIPSGNLVLFASAAWSFFIGKIGVGVQASFSAALPIEFGVSFSNQAAYFLSNLNLSLGGKAGVYYVLLKFSFKKKCLRWGWFKLCIYIPRISYSNPRFIVSVNWNTKSTSVIIPYIKIGL